MVEYDLAKILERLEQKIDKVIESQARQEEQIKSLQKGQDETKEETKDIRKDIKGRVAIQTYWLLVLMTFLIGLVVKFAFWPINNP